MPDTAAAVADTSTPAAAPAAPAAPAAATTETPADKPTEAAAGEAKDGAPKPDEPAKPTALERAKAAADRERQRQATRRREQFERQQMAAEAQRRGAEAAQYQQQLAAERAERERLAGLVAKAKEDPLSYLSELGVTADAIAKRALSESTPEAALKRFETELAQERAERERLAKQIADREEADKRRTAQAQADARYRAAEDRFLKLAADEAKYPAVASHVALRPRALVREATQLMIDAKKETGFDYTDEETLEYLESVYSKAQPSKKEAAAKSQDTKSTAETSTGSGNQEKASAGKPRTLTNDGTAQRGSLPANFDELSDAEQKRLMADQLRRMTRG